MSAWAVTAVVLTLTLVLGLASDIMGFLSSKNKFNVLGKVTFLSHTLLREH